MKEYIIRMVLFMLLLVFLLDGIMWMFGKKNFPIFRWVLRRLEDMVVWILKLPFRGFRAGWAALFKHKEKKQ